MGPFPLKGVKGFKGRGSPPWGEGERYTFGVGAVPKSSARDVLGGFEPVLNYSVKPLASVGGKYHPESSFVERFRGVPEQIGPF